MSEQLQFILPDLTTIVPFPWACNPHHTKASADSSAWMNSFSILDGDKIGKHQLELLASYMFPDAKLEELRICCDFINVITALDDSSDVQNGKGAKRSSDSFLSAIRNESVVEETNIYRLVSDFRERATQRAGPDCMRRFMEQYEKFCAAIAKEAELRERGCSLEIELLMQLRRDGSGVQPCVWLIEYIHEMELPGAVFGNETFQRMYWAGIDMLCLTNDLYSFNAERARGVAAANVMTFLTKEKGLSLQQAADFIGEEHKRLVKELMAASDQMPTFGGNLDEDVRKYIHSMKQVIIGNVIWCLETPRYFGEWENPLQRDRLVKLWDVTI